MTAAELAKALGGKRVGDEWMARCPAHADKTPSLSIGEGDNGHPVVHCHATCTQEAVIEALRAKGLWNGVSRFLTLGLGSGTRYQGDSTAFIYRDADGRKLGEVVRFEPKGFAQRFREVGGKWKGPERPWPVYGLERLAARPDAPVMVCEGEKAADAAQQLLPEYVCITSLGAC